jgi:hypothetical protein
MGAGHGLRLGIVCIFRLASGRALRQLTDVLAIEKTLRWFRLWVGFVGLTGERDQAGDLVLTPLRVSRSASVSLGPTLVATAIDLHDDDTRRVGNLYLEFAESMSFGLIVAFGDQLSADCLSQSPDVPTTDRETRQESERLGGQLERWEHCAGVNDLGQYRRTVAVGIKFEIGPLGEKSPFDTRGSEQPVPAT